AQPAERRQVRAAGGGPHPGLARPGPSARLGGMRFLEVTAPAPPPRSAARARRLAGMTPPRLIMWAARTPSAAETAARAKAEGYQAAVVEGHRARPDGTVVRWTNVFVTDHGGGALVPFFIEWHGDSHPADDG